jgi:hypothetical protein
VLPRRDWKGLSRPIPHIRAASPCGMRRGHWRRVYETGSASGSNRSQSSSPRAAQKALLEVSAVAVPSDTSAKVLARAVRHHVACRLTDEDRRVLARAHQQRAALDDAAARTYEDRLAIIAKLTGRR